MVIVMRSGATQEQVNSVVERVQQAGLTVHLSQGLERAIIGVIGHGGDVRMVVDAVGAMAGVENLVPVTKPFKLSSREFHEGDSVVQVGGVSIGGEEVVVIGGPCSVESTEQTLATAHAVKAAGGKLLRGGA
ncbi:MAG: 3-deoxy-7-phosphoheptulonate synthase, partial [Chloroflexota bacterium]|nr:3-deoxy-7-phosphoheptulonate synthase [Chloroflexota bacterium]